MDVVHLIQSAVAPVFFLSGVGVTLSVLTNRLARRAHYINTAMALCTVSALFVSLLVISLFANAFVPMKLSAVIAILFALSMICLTAAFGAFLVEVRLATATLRFGPLREAGYDRAA